MHWVLRIASLVLFAVTALFFIEDNITTEWRRAQSEYQDRLLESATTDAQAAYASSFELRPRQIELPELGRVDRCVSCHVGVENPGAANWPLPLATHSGDLLLQHDIERMGCTVCHDGQGRATTAEAAHAWVDGLHWDKPVLRGSLLQSACARCHKESLPFAATFERGRQLFDTHGCRGCHRVADDGMSFGPELTRVGDASFSIKRPTSEGSGLIDRFGGNVNAAYIYESVRYPKAQPADSLMPHFDFSDDETEALTVYLKGLTESISVLRIISPVKQAEREEVPDRGERLFERYCAGCHGLGGHGGVVNPNAVKETIPRLDQLAERLMLYEPEMAGVFVEYLVENGGPPEDPEVLDLPRGRVTMVQYEMVHNLVHSGNRSGKKDSTGPSPIDMPTWGETLSEDDITAIVAWLLTQFPWEE